MEKKIFYYDTDAGGVVYYGNYLKYLEESRTELLEAKGLSIKKLKKSGFEYAVRKCSIIYKKPARYGDIITSTASIKKITAVQIFFYQEICNKQTKELLIEAEVSLVSINQNFKAASIPENIKKVLLS